MAQKVLVSLPKEDLRRIDAAARRQGETRSAFMRKAALARIAGGSSDDPAARRALELILRRAEDRFSITTAQALAARDRGRR